ncbi:Cupin 1, partial [Dillenia turbinata]
IGKTSFPASSGSNICRCPNCTSADPDILYDFIVPLNMSSGKVNGKFFTYTGMRVLAGSPYPSELLKASKIEFPAFNGLSVLCSMTSTKFSYLTLVIATFAIAQTALAGDPDILSDFIIPPNMTLPDIDGNFFTFTGMRVLVGAPEPTKFTVLKASMAEFPALNGQSVSYAVLQYPAGSINPPHTHPRASELLFVIDGSLEVGFVDTTNKLYTQTLELGDMFIFPKGLVHYQYNADANNSAIAVSAFGSAGAGTVSVPLSVFTTNIDDTILAEAFKTDVATIQKLKAGLAPPKH